MFRKLFSFLFSSYNIHLVALTEYCGILQWNSALAKHWEYILPVDPDSAEVFATRSSQWSWPAWQRSLAEEEVTAWKSALLM